MIRAPYKRLDEEVLRDLDPNRNLHPDPFLGHHMNWSGDVWIASTYQRVNGKLLYHPDGSDWQNAHTPRITIKPGFTYRALCTVKRTSGTIGWGRLFMRFTTPEFGDQAIQGYNYGSAVADLSVLGREDILEVVGIAPPPETPSEMVIITQTRGPFTDSEQEYYDYYVYETSPLKVI